MIRIDRLLRVLCSKPDGWLGWWRADQAYDVVCSHAFATLSRDKLLIVVASAIGGTIRAASSAVPLARFACVGMPDTDLSAHSFPSVLYRGGVAA